MAEGKLEDFFRKQGKNFHKLFDKNVEEVQHYIFSKYYKNEPSKVFNSHHYNNQNYFSLRFFKEFSPFTSNKERILLKPFVSKVPISTSKILLILWLILLIFTTSFGNNLFNDLKGYKYISGFPGKSITHIDIRNQEIPNRNDGYDDNKKCAFVKIPYRYDCE